MISRIASFTVAAVLATSALPLAPAAGASATPPWTRPQPSASMDPEKVIAQARSRGHMRVLYALRDGTDLDIRTEEVSGRADAAKYIAQLQRNPQLIAVQIDEKVPVQTASVTDAGPAALSMDPFRQNQWALTQLQAESVWPLGTGSDQTVAVIDTGVLVHQDLAGSFVPGADFVTPGGSGRLTNNTHGTHVAGIIAMTPNNNLGGAGLAPGVSIMPIRMIASENLQSLANLALSVDYAVDAGADVLNMSLAWYPGTNTSVPAAAIQRALDRGVDVVAAAGNEYEKNNPIPFPASYPGVIGVAATTSNNNLSANYSNEGYYVDVAAPGSDILSTTTQGVYAYQDGTSMATPYVAATLALLRSREERVGVRIDEVQLMYDTALELGTPGRDDRYGYGLIQPLRAMQSITAPAPAPPAPAPPAPAPPAPAPPAPAPAPAPAQPTPKPKSRVTVAIRKDAGKVAFKIRHAGRFRVKLQRKVPGTWVTRATTSRVKGKRWHTFRKKYRGKLRVVVRHSSYRGKSSTVVVF